MAAAVAWVYGAGVGLCVLLCSLLWVRKRLPRQLTSRLGKTALWQRLHLGLGLLSVPLVIGHCRLETGWGWQCVSRLLLAAYLVVFVTGCASWFLGRLLPLKKFGDKGKAKTAAVLIEMANVLTMALHVPLTLTLWVFLLAHVWGKLYYR